MVVVDEDLVGRVPSMSLSSITWSYRLDLPLLCKDSKNPILRVLGVRMESYNNRSILFPLVKEE